MCDAVVDLDGSSQSCCGIVYRRDKELLTSERVSKGERNELESLVVDHVAISCIADIQLAELFHDLHFGEQ